MAQPEHNKQDDLDLGAGLMIHSIHKSTRTAVTMIELLVVLGIISILIATLLLGVATVRKAGPVTAPTMRS